MNSLWSAVLCGFTFFILGLLLVISGTDGDLWGGNVPAWTGWLFIPGGLFIIIYAILGIMRGEGKPKVPTDEDIANAKAALEKMYLKEHGMLPEYPDKEQKGGGSGEPKAAKTQ